MLENIKSPAWSYRPAPFWSWNDKLNEVELRRQLSEMSDNGWGSCFMHSRVGLVTGYLSDDWMRMINACAEEGAKIGVRTWLYDEDKWPSGFAGGFVPSLGPEYRARGLVLVTKGSATEHDTVLETVERNGITWQICERISPMDDPRFNGSAYVDLLNPKVVEAFLQSTHEKYREACGKHFGESIVGVFTDEPCALLSNQYEVPAVPWSSVLADFFRGIKGYDISANIQALFFDEGDYRRVRFDFYDVVVKLFAESFVKPYYNWCEQNGLLMTGHYLIEGTLREQVQWVGDVMPLYEHMHWPGIDVLGRLTAELVTVKQVASVAEQLGKERVLCESYGGSGGQVSFLHRKWMGDWLSVLGVGFLNPHLSLYSMRGERKRDYPPNLFWQQPWWKYERGFADYQSRLLASTTEGRDAAEILVVSPITSVWCEYSPLHLMGDFAQEGSIDKPFALLSETLSAEKLPFHYGSESIMENHSTVDGSRLKVGNCSYSCVIIPPAYNLKKNTVELLRDYAANGGRLVFVGGLPANVDGTESNLGIENAEIVPTVQAAIRLVSSYYPKRVQAIDRLTGINAPDIWVRCQTIGSSRRYTFINRSEYREVRAEITIPDTSPSLAVFDPSDGGVYRLTHDSGRFDITLYPAGSLVVLVGDEAEAVDADMPAVLGCGAICDSLETAVPKVVIDSLQCETLEENVLPLADFSLELDGEVVYSGPVCGALHTHFYPAAEGTPFAATYEFPSEYAAEGCFAVIEMAENLDCITLNGESIHPLRSSDEPMIFDQGKCWKDQSLVKVPLPALRIGTNVLKISGRKINNISGINNHHMVSDWNEHRPTEAEEVYICGQFAVRKRGPGRWAIASPVEPCHKNLTTDGYPFYCGSVRLSGGFNINTASNRVYMRLLDGRFASAEVSVNNRRCGVVRWSPYVVDITDAIGIGVNTFQIEISTTLVNAFGPNRVADIKNSRGIGPYSFVHMGVHKREHELFDFGIGGIALICR